MKKIILIVLLIVSPVYADWNIPVGSGGKAYIGSSATDIDTQLAAKVAGTVKVVSFAGAPTQTDDTPDYAVNDEWTDTTTGCKWIAKDVTSTAAVWVNQCRPPLAQDNILVGDSTGYAAATSTLPIVTFGNGATSSGYFYLLEDSDNGTNKFKYQGPQALASDLSGTIQTAPTTANAGTVMWGNSDDTTDTGNEVCALAGLTCVDVKAPNGTDSDCTTDQGTVGTYFYALCKE